MQLILNTSVGNRDRALPPLWWQLASVIFLTISKIRVHGNRAGCGRIKHGPGDSAEGRYAVACETQHFSSVSIAAEGPILFCM